MYSKENRRVGEMIRAGRKVTNLSQKDLGQLCGVSTAAVTLWEKGEVDLPLSRAIRICDIFGWSLDRLTNRDEKPLESLLAQR